MALSIGAVGAYADDYTDATLPLPVPAGVTSGTLVCAVIMVYGNTWTDPTIQSGPSGSLVSDWTLGSKGSALSAFGFTFTFYRFYKIATASDTGTYTVAKSVNEVYTGRAFIVSGWTGGSANPWVDSLHEAANESGSSTIASWTPGGDGSVIVAYWLADNATAPSGLTSNGSATSLDGDTINLASAVQTTATATPSWTFGSGESVVSIGTLRQSSITSVLGVKFGTTAINSVMLGSTEIKKIYLGTTLIHHVP